jgi:thioredoxin-dependent peroxiredoxin
VLSEFESLGIKVIGTSVDTVGKLEKFRDKYEIRFPFVSDEDRAIGSAFGTLKGDLTSTHERDTFLVDTDGTILLAYQRVRAEGHAATVLNDARRLREEGRV